MRRFVLIGQKARASPDFLLDDVPGRAGVRRAPALLCGSALVPPHGLRRDTLVYLVLLGGGTTAPRSLRIDGRVAEYVRPDERSLAGRVKAMLETKAEVGFAAERQGMAVADGGLDVVLADLGDGARYILDEGGNDVRDEPLELENPVFFVGDHLGFDDATRATLVAEQSRLIHVGPISVHADDAIALVSGMSRIGARSGRAQTRRNHQIPRAQSDFSVAFMRAEALAVRVQPTGDSIMAKPTTAAKKTKPLSKSAILQAVSEAIGEEISRKHTSRASSRPRDRRTAHREPKKTGAFVLPGFAKFVVVEEGRSPGPRGDQPVHQGEAEVRCQAREQVGPRAPGEGHQRRSELRFALRAGGSAGNELLGGRSRSRHG